MSAQSTEWARKVLTRRMIWRPLGVTLSLWAWFGWITPWFTALLPYGREARIPNPAVFILGAALLGHLSAAAMTWMNAPGTTSAVGRLLTLLATLGAGWWAYAAAPLGGLAASAAGERAQWQATWVAVLLLGYTWWRAARLSAGEALEPESTLLRLFTGTLLAAAAIVLFPDAWRAGGLAFLPLYVGGGLAAVSLGQIEDASRRRGGRPLPFDLSWHAAILLGVALVTGLGVGVGWLLNSDPAWNMADAVARALAAAARVLASALAPVVEALIRFLGPIFEAVVGLLRSWMVGAGEARIAPLQPLMLGGDEGLAGEQASRLLAQLGVILRVLVSVLGVAQLLWMAVRTAGRPHRASADGDPETFEQVADLPAKGRGHVLAEFLWSAVRLPSRARGLYHALLVRRVYAQLLEWAAREGRPWRMAETPHEYATELAGPRPELREDLEAVTRAYVQVRYGEVPESAEMVNAVLASWDRVRRSVSAAQRKGEGNSR